MTSPAVIIQILQIQTQSIKKNRLKTLLNSFFSKTKKVNSYNGLQIKFSDCAFKTKKKKKIKNSALQKQKSNKLP